MTDYTSKTEATNYAATLDQNALKIFISEVKSGVHTILNTVDGVTTRWYLTAYSLATNIPSWSRSIASEVQYSEPVESNTGNDDDVQWWEEGNSNRTVMTMMGDYAVTLNLKTGGTSSINPTDSNGHDHWDLADSHLVMKYIQAIADLQYYDQDTVLVHGEYLYKGALGGDQAIEPTSATDDNWQITASVDRTKHTGEQSLASISDAGSMASQNIWSGTQAELDAIATRDANTFYLIPEVTA